MLKIRPKILIVEDEPPILRVLSDRFNKEGFVVFEAKDGVEGYKAALESHPDIILLDILMPVVDGLSMLKKLCKNDACKDIPVILLTNLEDSAAVSQALEMGVYDYMVKSDWKLEDVVKKVKERLGLIK